MTKRFAWSWSKLKNYRTCPKRHYEIDIAKTAVEKQSEALLWGNNVHDAMARYIAQGQPLPVMMQRYEDWPRRVKALKDEGIDVKVEQRLAIDEQFRACNYFDAGTWFRSVIDVQIMLPQIKAAITIDWKTGNEVKPEFEQLALSAQVMFAHFPELEEVGTIYVWFGHDTQTVKVYRRPDLPAVWGQVMPWVQRMLHSHETLSYPPTPSGLCKKYCPVVACPYYGKGTMG